MIFSKKNKIHFFDLKIKRPFFGEKMIFFFVVKSMIFSEKKMLPKKMMMFVEKKVMNFMKKV